MVHRFHSHDLQHQRAPPEVTFTCVYTRFTSRSIGGLHFPNTQPAWPRRLILVSVSRPSSSGFGQLFASHLDGWQFYACQHPSGARCNVYDWNRVVCVIDRWGSAGLELLHRRSSTGKVGTKRWIMDLGKIGIDWPKYRYCSNNSWNARWNNLKRTKIISIFRRKGRCLEFQRQKQR